jgi:hypothetical protein
MLEHDEYELLVRVEMFVGEFGISNCTFVNVCWFVLRVVKFGGKTRDKLLLMSLPSDYKVNMFPMCNWLCGPERNFAAQFLTREYGN